MCLRLSCTSPDHIWHKGESIRYQFADRISNFYWVAVWQFQSKVGGICSVLFFFFSSVSVKVLPVTPLVSGIFVHRAFCAYFLRIERVVDTVESLTLWPAMASKVM